MAGLQQKLDAIRARFVKKAPAEAIEVMHRAMGSPPFGTEEIEAFLSELEALGLVQREEPEKRTPVAIEAPAELEAPRILWQEKVEQIAATCAFLPAQNPLCNQVPVS